MTKQRTKSRFKLKKRYGILLSFFSLILFLGSCEIGLRMMNMGYPTDFYRKTRDDTGESWIRENRWFVAPYFSRDLIRRPQPFRIKENKAENTFRIFILGSSAAMGDPEASFSMARVLKLMLEEAHPEINFEVINAAMTAINSHVVKKIAADCAGLEPDIYIVYEGNNEVIGPFGPTGVFSKFQNSSTGIEARMIWRRSRLGQVIGKLSGVFGKDKNVMQEWGGMGMFLKHEFRNTDPRLNTVNRFFGENLKSIINSGYEAGASVFLCTVVVNQRDFAPFLSRNRDRMVDEEAQQWEGLITQGDEEFVHGRHESARKFYESAWEIDDQHAGLAFKQGRLALSINDDDAARRFLALACDLDTLRFRTDSRLNSTIRKISADNEGRATLVDLAENASKQCPHGIPGDEWLYEHVHLTLYGTFLNAQALYREVEDDLLKKGMVTSRQKQILDYITIRNRLGFTFYEQALIIHELLNRFSKPPFTGQMDHGIRMATWEKKKASADKLLLQEEKRQQILDEYARALALKPDDWILQRNYGMALVAFQKPELARPLLESASRVINDDPDTLFALAYALQETGDKVKAKKLYQRLKLLEPNYPGLPE